MNAKKRKLFRNVINEALKPDSATIAIQPMSDGPDFGDDERYINIVINGINPDAFMDFIANEQDLSKMYR